MGKIRRKSYCQARKSLHTPRLPAPHRHCFAVQTAHHNPPTQVLRGPTKALEVTSLLRASNPSGLCCLSVPLSQSSCLPNSFPVLTSREPQLSFHPCCCCCLFPPHYEGPAENTMMRLCRRLGRPNSSAFQFLLLQYWVKRICAGQALPLNAPYVMIKHFPRATAASFNFVMCVDVPVYGCMCAYREVCTYVCVQCGGQESTFVSFLRSCPSWFFGDRISPWPGSRLGWLASKAQGFTYFHLLGDKIITTLSFCFYYHYLCMGFLSACMSMWSPGTGVTDSCELPSGC